MLFVILVIFCLVVSGFVAWLFRGFCFCNFGDFVDYPAG